MTIHLGWVEPPSRVAEDSLSGEGFQACPRLQSASSLPLPRAGRCGQEEVSDQITLQRDQTSGVMGASTSLPGDAVAWCDLYNVVISIDDGEQLAHRGP